jgi:hypothetical protein
MKTRTISRSGRPLGEGVNRLEAEDTDRSTFLLRPWIVGSDPHSLEQVEVGYFVDDRVFVARESLSTLKTWRHD